MSSVAVACDEDRAFNHYNTEVVKLDSNNWLESGELLVAPPADQWPIHSTSFGHFLAEQDVDQTMPPSYAPDSINVLIFLEKSLIISFFRPWILTRIQPKFNH